MHNGKYPTNALNGIFAQLEDLNDTNHPMFKTRNSCFFSFTLVLLDETVCWFLSLAAKQNTYDK